jgi:hypothetical protein
MRACGEGPTAVSESIFDVQRFDAPDEVGRCRDQKSYKVGVKQVRENEQ